MKSKWILLGVVASLAVLAAGAAFAADGSVLANAIAKQVETAPETLNMQAEPGYLGIPGGPKVNMILAFGWALWVGWIFSTVGAFGGVMAGVGHMTVHGLGPGAMPDRHHRHGGRAFDHHHIALDPHVAQLWPLRRIEMPRLQRRKKGLRRVFLGLDHHPTAEMIGL